MSREGPKEGRLTPALSQSGRLSRPENLKKRLGQNFLTDSEVLRMEAQALRCGGMDVLEIGAGDGRLSKFLLEEEPKSLTLVEPDERWRSHLAKKFQNDWKRVRVVKADFLKMFGEEKKNKENKPGENTAGADNAGAPLSDDGDNFAIPIKEESWEIRGKKRLEDGAGRPKKVRSRTVVVGRALQADQEAGAKAKKPAPKNPDAIIGNIPYYITSPIIIEIARLRPKVCVLCMQKEVALRLSAPPASSEYGRMSVFAQLNFEIEILANVPAHKFHPVPKVDSSIVRLTPKDCSAIPKNFEKVSAALFSHRLASVANAIYHSRKALSLGKEEARLAGKSIKFLDRKVFMLTPDEVLEIARILS